MADEAARRRELRRRKILENAEERKRKIFGTTKIKEDKETPVCEDPPLPPLTRQTPPTEAFPLREGSVPAAEDPMCDVRDVRDSIDTGQPPLVAPNSHNSSEDSFPLNTPLTSTPRPERHSPTVLSPGSRLLNGTVPDSTEQFLNLSRLSSVNGSLGSPGAEATPRPEPEPSRAVVVPVVLALLVCCLLSLNLGYIVSNSIAFPFLLWESHSLWCRWQALQAASRGRSSLLVVALMLSGVNQTTISTYVVIMNVMKCFMEDFFLYIFTVVMWSSTVGLPGVQG
ncbi:hypothetical protein O3P69_005529 [Scylla paramamosain]|uniref:Uncharacterized protein n=1 Tax=Scylla paramamosain TaxID=85552 RepID=A0AAW0U900_SCYPA